MWHDDPVFAPGGAFHGEGSPTFRLTGYFPYGNAHPYRLTEQWQALFDCYAPFVKQHCDRVVMWDDPGANARRGLKIKPGDWRPFEHIKSVHDDPESGIFTGFSFLDRADGAEGNGRGPCSFRFFVRSNIQLDACIPLADWQAGRLDIDRVVAAMQALPYLSFIAGYGLSMGTYFAQDEPEALMDYARRFPAVDLLRDEDRANFSGGMENYAAIGIAGINWITGVGEPFRGRAGGAAALGAGAPAAVGIADGPNGVVFRLGGAPVGGEAGVDDATLPLFHWLGGKLATVGQPAHEGRHAPVFGRDAVAQSLAWQKRFMGAAR